MPGREGVMGVKIDLSGRHARGIKPPSLGATGPFRGPGKVSPCPLPGTGT